MVQGCSKLRWPQAATVTECWACSTIGILHASTRLPIRTASEVHSEPLQLIYLATVQWRLSGTCTLYLKQCAARSLVHTACLPPACELGSEASNNQKTFAGALHERWAVEFQAPIAVEVQR